MTARFNMKVCLVDIAIPIQIYGVTIGILPKITELFENATIEVTPAQPVHPPQWLEIGKLRYTTEDLFNLVMAARNSYGAVGDSRNEVVAGPFSAENVRLLKALDPFLAWEGPE